MRQLDPQEMYHRALGSNDPAAVLDEVEMLVFVVMDLETYMDMEGWDAFFVGNQSHLYPLLRQCLTAAGAARSLAVIDDYVAYHSTRGVPFEPEAIDELACRETEAVLRARPDWRSHFSDASGERWLRIGEYLRSRGIELVSSAPDLGDSPEAAKLLTLFAATKPGSLS
jgi:hypothetical protein